MKSGCGKGVWFYFFPVITYNLLPSSLEDDFTVFFFPSGSGGVKKKNRQPNFVSKPKLEKIHAFWGLIMTFFCHGFFFSPEIPREKKEP